MTSNPVWLVGAGPGDPDLLTRKAARLLETAHLVAYDELVSPEILALIPASALKFAVGRRAGDDPAWAARTAWLLPDGSIAPVVVELAKQGKTIVRLKGGDPAIFARTNEELAALAKAGLSAEIVPGITAAVAAASRLQIPLTDRAGSTSVTFATAHSAEDHRDLVLEAQNWPKRGTLVLYMGLRRLDTLTRALVRAGWERDTRAAVVSRATAADERWVIGTLANIADKADKAGLETPALVMVGDVLATARASYGLRERINSESNSSKREPIGVPSAFQALRSARARSTM